MDPDFYEKFKRIKRERFRDEIRKPQIEETLNSKRLSHKFSYIDSSFPILEDNPDGFFRAIILKLSAARKLKDLPKIQQFLLILRKFSSLSEEPEFRLKIFLQGGFSLALACMEEFEGVLKVQSEALWLVCNLASVEEGYLESWDEGEMGRMFEMLMKKLKGGEGREGRREEEGRGGREKKEGKRDEVEKEENGGEEKVKVEEEERNKMENQMKTDVIWSFINFCGDSIVLAEMALKKGLVGKLIELLKGRTPELSLLKDVLALLRGISGLKNIFRKDEFFYEFVKLIPILIICIKIDDIEVQYYTYNILSDITYSSERITAFQEIMSKEDLRLILEHLLHSEDKIRMVVNRFICNFLSAENLSVEIFLEFGILDKFCILLDSKKDYMKREILWGISNILATDEATAEKFIQHEIYKKLWLQVKSPDFMIKREAIFCFTNLLTFCSFSLLPSLLTPSLLAFFCEMLDFQEVSIALAILDAIEKALESCNVGLSEIERDRIKEIVICSDLERNLEALQYHPTQKVFERSGLLLEKYFDTEEKRQ